MFRPKRAVETGSGENFTMRSFLIFSFFRYYGDQIKENETAKACSTHGEMYTMNPLQGHCREDNIKIKLILKWIFKRWSVKMWAEFI
jgi:hypothetical protein